MSWKVGWPGKHLGNNLWKTEYLLYGFWFPSIIPGSWLFKGKRRLASSSFSTSTPLGLTVGANSIPWWAAFVLVPLWSVPSCLEGPSCHQWLKPNLESWIEIIVEEDCPSTADVFGASRVCFHQRTSSHPVSPDIKAFLIPLNRCCRSLFITNALKWKILKES